MIGKYVIILMNMLPNSTIQRKILVCFHFSIMSTAEPTINSTHNYSIHFSIPFRIKKNGSNIPAQCSIPSSQFSLVLKLCVPLLKLLR